MSRIGRKPIAVPPKVKVEVKLNLVGTAIGVKEGGMLDFSTHTVEIECLPTDIPEQIDIDVTGLGIGQSVHIGELKVPAGVKVFGYPRASVVSILGRAKEEGAAAAE